MGRTEIKINGKPVPIDDEAAAITDLDRDLAMAGSQVSWAGRMWAEAEAEEQLADAAYRAWRATMIQKLLADDPRLPEWKAKACIEAHRMFLKLKKGKARAKRNVVLLRGHARALVVKAELVRSKGAMARAELESSSTVYSKEVIEERQAAMRDKNRRRNAVRKRSE